MDGTPFLQKNLNTPGVFCGINSKLNLGSKWDKFPTSIGYQKTINKL